MNKYLKRGLILTVAGILIGLLGSFLQDEELGVYKWVLTLGVVLFGIGFLTILYSLIRKIERKSLENERTEQQNEADETP